MAGGSNVTRERPHRGLAVGRRRRQWLPPALRIEGSATDRQNAAFGSNAERSRRRPRRYRRSYRRNRGASLADFESVYRGNVQTGLCFGESPGSIVFMGLGLWSQRAGGLPWLAEAECVYWGDLDTMDLRF